MRRFQAFLAASLAGMQLAWLGGGGPIAAGNRLFEEGKYDEATQKYGEALIDNPGSEIARFNLAAAQYAQGKFNDAVSSLAQVATAEPTERAARAAYNLGNAYFRLGQSGAESDPQAAIATYEQALVAYKRSMAADPSFEDAVFNHEFVQRELEELKKKLEEQQQERPPPEENQDQENPEQQQDEQQEQAQDQNPQQPGEEQQEPQPEEQQQAQGGEEEQPQQEQPSADSTGESEGESEEEMDRQQAAAVIDAARAEEVNPEEIDRSEGAVVGVPLRDW